MADDIVTRLRVKDSIYTEFWQQKLMDEAADEIVRLREQVAARFDRQTVANIVGSVEDVLNAARRLHDTQVIQSDLIAAKDAEIERLRAVLDAIDALHQPDYEYPDECTECDFAWPCDTHLLIQPKKANDE